MKAELLDRGWWRRQDAALLTGIVASHINAIATLTYSMLGFDIDSPVSTPVNIALAVADKALIEGKFDLFVAMTTARDVAITEKITHGDPLAKAAVMIKEYAEKIAASTELPEDQRAFRKEVADQVEMIDKEMQKYDNRIQQADELIIYKIGLLKLLNNYLNTHPMPPPSLP